MKIVIMAGGKGSRIAGLNSELPKPMLPIAGKPVLQWQIECLKRQGFDDITVAVGYLGNAIKDFFGNEVAFVEELEPLGTAGALYLLKDEIDEDFLLINGDIIFDVDIRRFVDAHKRNGALATIFTHPNDHPYDSGLVVTDGSNRVIKWLTKEEERGFCKNRVNAGMHMLSPSVLQQFKQLVKVDLDRDVLKPMAPSGMLFAYDSSEYVKDMGTPERFFETEEDIISGKTAAKNLANKQKCVFIDRDGTINEHVGFLNDVNSFILIDGAAQVIKRINKMGYLAIVVTNQPVIARGEATWQMLNEIHNKMETLLGEQGAYVDDIFICPHHPHKGFPGEVEEYKIECLCRKPEPGMLFAAAEKYNIDISKSYMVGDSPADTEAGKRAGCAGQFTSLKEFSEALEGQGN